MTKRNVITLTNGPYQENTHYRKYFYFENMNKACITKKKQKKNIS